MTAQGNSKLSRSTNSKQRQNLQNLLKFNEFRQLWIGQIFSQLADKFYIVLMVYLIAQNWVISGSEGSGALEGLASASRIDFDKGAQRITLLATGIYFANSIPAMILGTIAGVGADRWPKKKVMLASNGLRAILLLFTPISLIPGPIFYGISWGYWALLLMTLLESSLTQFFAPAEQATIPLLIPKEHLLTANSLYQATSMGATIIGFALGDTILRLLNHISLALGIQGGEFLLLPFCYGMATLKISSIHLKEIKPKFTNKGLWEEIGTAIKVVKEKSSVRRAIVHLAMLYSLLAALYVLSISLTSSIESLGPTQFGTLLAISGVGMVIGAISLAQTGYKFNKKKLTSAGLITIALSLLLLAQFTGSLSATFILCALLGVGAALVAIPSQTTLQEDTPENLRGKVFGLQNNLINISLSIPLVISGALVSSYGLVPVLWILAGLTVFAVILESPWRHC